MERNITRDDDLPLVFLDGTKANADVFDTMTTASKIVAKILLLNMVRIFVGRLERNETIEDCDGYAQRILKCYQKVSKMYRIDVTVLGRKGSVLPTTD